MLRPNLASEPTPPASRHLPVEVLRQYAAGALTPAEQHQVEAHTLDCTDCADILEGLELQPAAVTDASMADLRRRLGARVEELATESKPKPALGLAWQQLAAAAVLLLTLGAAVVWFALLRPVPLSTASRPVAGQRAAIATAPIAPTTPKLITPEAGSAASAPEVATIAAEPTSSSRTSLPLRRSAGHLSRSRKRMSMQDAPYPPSEFIDAEELRDCSAIMKIGSMMDSAATTASAEAKEYAVATPQAALPIAGSPAAARRKMAAVASAAAPMVAGTRLVQGRITDKSSGEGMAGATVLVEGTTTGTVTAADGSFSLVVPATAKQLVVSSVGYAAQAVPVPAEPTNLALALAPDSRQLSEVVVVRRDAPPAPMSVGAMPAGGYAGLKKYLRDSLDYPEKALEDRREGNVKLRFVVGVDGKLSDIKVVKKLSEECDAEAIRLLQEGPAWFPAIQNGRRTARTVEITVPFKMEDR
ncbi:TonB family protein [Hymenobacter sp. HSC-4F20]|uniref:TonB family protein n=1 Tax=Hymenobacter sp. HSC-4F20 TaxID=2864135 RepID=UPI001C72B605|nr:TonB family protein [Hymenobacter sp. HSC-4F20]MBX0291786.1 TonB family protein [Hymenobacter sp. HSC-4F20]